MWRLDAAVFRLINDLAERSAFADALGYFAAHWLLPIMILTTVIYVLAPRHRIHVERAVTASWAGLAALFGLASNHIISLYYFRPRPFVTLSEVHKLVDVSMTQKSFPSDHTTVAFAVAASVALRHPRLGLPLFVAAAFVAFGRVYAGVHYPSDILGGILMGVFWAYVVRVIGPRLGEIERFEKIVKRFGRKL